MYNKFALLILFISATCFNSFTLYSQDNVEPTPIPLAVLRAQSYIQFVSLIMENGGCELPCWWGFKVGEADETEWWQFLENQNLRMARDDSEPRAKGTISAESRTFYPTILGEDGTDLSFYFLEKDILTGLRIDISRPDRWFSVAKHLSIRGLLSQQEETPDIYYISDSTTDLWLLVVYPEIPFSVQYGFHPTAYNLDDNGELTLCLGMFDTKQIILNIENHTFPTPLYDRFQQLIDSSESRHSPIEESSLFNSVSTDELINLIIEHKDNCFQIEVKE